MEGLGVLEFAT